MMSPMNFIFSCIFIPTVLYSSNVVAKDSLECVYKHRHYSWTKITYIRDPKIKKPEERKDWQNMDFIFTLDCYDQIATVSYERHILDKFKVKSCDTQDFESEILLSKLPDKTATLDERELPTSVNIYYIKNGRHCYAVQYNFKNYEEGDKDASEIEKHGPTKSLCSREVGLDDEGVNTELAVFGNCKTGTFLYKNVNNVKSFANEWYPAALELDPPGSQTDKGTPHRKLLQCSYKTGTYHFKLLCIKLTGRPHYLAYVGEYSQSVDMEIFTLQSCQEDHIVNSIFPPNYSVKQPETGPVHVFKYAYFTGKCVQRSYNCKGHTGQVVGTPVSTITCPSRADITSGSLGRWENCQGPLKSPSIIDLTVN